MASLLSSERVVGLDVARALALVGMMATHILPDIDLDGVTVGHQIAGGRASALFAVLAGVSIALMSGRTTPQHGRARAATAAGLAVRALLIAVLGLLLGEVEADIAVILTYYGLLFLLALPFLGLGPVALAALAGVFAVAAPVVSHLLRPHLPRPSYADPTFAHLDEPARLLSELAFTGYYPAVPWTAYMLAGMALGRLPLGSWRTTGRVTALGAVLALVSWAASDLLMHLPGVRGRLIETFTGPAGRGDLDLTLDRGLYGSTPTGSWWWLTTNAPHTATPFDLLHTIGTSLLVIGVCVAAGRLAPVPLAVAFGAGAMTLTLYSAHVWVRGEGRWDADTTGTFLGQVTVVLAVGAAYRLARRRGPLEAAVGVVQTQVRQAAAGRARR